MRLRTTSSGKMIADLLRFKVSPGEVAYKRITQKLRDLILSKALLPGTRLPTLTELARLWNTNYFTVQTALTPLANEGLLVRKQRRGTFVTESKRQIKTVGIYFGGSLWRVKHAAFYQTLYAALCDHFERLGIAVHLFMDSRPRGQQGSPLKPLNDAIRRSEVSAVVGAMTTTEEVEWLEKLPVPVSVFCSGASETSASVGLEMGEFLRSSMVRLKERKCRSVALICGDGLPNFDSFFDLAKEIGLKALPEWALQRNSWPEEFEEFGYESFGKIWSGTTKPDGLIVYPDNIALGVIMAILQKGAQVPSQLKLVMHCNEEVYIHCPLPADWQVVSVVKIVDALWKQLRAQADGGAPGQLSLGITLQPPTSKLPIMFRRWESGGAQFTQNGGRSF